MKPYIDLFSIFFKIGAFTFGGGYAMIPALEDELSKKRDLLTDTEFIEMVAICQCLPGAFALNCAVYAGRKALGLVGSIIAVFATSLPSFMIILLVAGMVENLAKNTLGIQIMGYVIASIAGVIFATALRLFKSQKRKSFDFVIVGFSFILLFIVHLSPIFVLLFSGLMGILVYGRGNQQ